MGIYLQVKARDGSIWAVPATAVAEDRATYYADQEAEGDPVIHDDIYHEEYAWTLAHDDALIEWAQRSMDWSDVEPLARMVRGPKAPPPDLPRSWREGPMRVVHSERKERVR